MSDPIALRYKPKLEEAARLQKVIDGRIDQAEAAAVELESMALHKVERVLGTFKGMRLSLEHDLQLVTQLQEAMEKTIGPQPGDQRP